MLERMSFLFRMIVDELHFILAEKSILSILIVIPILYPIVISWLYIENQPVDRPTLLIDHDNSSLSRQLAIGLDATEQIQITGRPYDVGHGFETMRKQQAELLVYIPREFSSRIKKGEQAKIKLWVNSANMLTYGITYPAVREVVLSTNKMIGERFLTEKGVHPALSKGRVMPISLAERLLYHPTTGYGDFLVTGVFLIIVQQIVLMGLAFSVGLRKERGLFKESERFPFTYLEAKVLAQLVFYLAGIAFIVFVIFPIFDWPVKNKASMFVLFVVFVITMAPLAIIAAKFVKDRYAAFQILMFFSTPLFMISGFAWPFKQMPELIQYVAAIFPATPALQAVRVLSMKSGNLEVVLPFIGWLGIQFLCYLVIAILLLRKSFSRLLFRADTAARA